MRRHREHVFKRRRFEHGVLHRSEHCHVCTVRAMTAPSTLQDRLAPVASRHPEWGFGHDLTHLFEVLDAPLLYNFANCYHTCIVPTGDAAYPYSMWFFGWSSWYFR